MNMTGRELDLATSMQGAIANIDVLIDILQTPRTDLEMIVDQELQSINRRLAIIAAALNIALEDE